MLEFFYNVYLSTDLSIDCNKGHMTSIIDISIYYSRQILTITQIIIL